MTKSKNQIEKFKKISQQVEMYIENGKLAENINKNDFVRQLQQLSPIEQASLRDQIDFMLPMDDLAYIDPLFAKIPKAGFFSMFVGLTASFVKYHSSENGYSAAVTFLATSAVTFFGQMQYKSYQINKMWDQRKQRASELLLYLSTLKDEQLTNLSIAVKL